MRPVIDNLAKGRLDAFGFPYSENGGKPSETGAEIIAEARLRLAESISGFDGPAKNAYPFLYSKAETQLDRHFETMLKAPEAELEFVKQNTPKEFPAPFELAHQSELAGRVRELLRTLPPKLEKVIRMRFGIDDTPHSAEEVAAHLGCTDTWARVLEALAMRNLKHPTRAALVKGFLD